MTTEQQIRKTNELITDVQREIVNKLKECDLTNEQTMKVILSISMGMSISVMLGRLEYQHELETESNDVINQIINQ